MDNGPSILIKGMPSRSWQDTETELKSILGGERSTKSPSKTVSHSMYSEESMS